VVIIKSYDKDKMIKYSKQNWSPKKYILLFICTLSIIFISGCQSKLDEPTKSAIIQINKQIDKSGKSVLKQIRINKNSLKKPSSSKDTATEKNNLKICMNINKSIQNAEKQFKEIKYDDINIPPAAQRLLAEKLNSYIEYYTCISTINNILIKNNGNMNLSESDLNKVKKLKFYSNMYIRKCKEANHSLLEYLKNKSIVLPFNFNETININGITYNVENAKWTKKLSDNKLSNKTPEHTYLYIKIKAKNTKGYDNKLAVFALLDDNGNMHELYEYSGYSKNSFTHIKKLSGKAKEEGDLIFDVPENGYYKLLIYNKSPKELRYIYVNPMPNI
jgi:hypothetical protein